MSSENSTIPLNTISQPMLPAPVYSESVMESHPSWPVLATLQMRMTVALPLDRFRVRDLLGLAKNSVVTTGWNQTEDVPLSGGGSQISWCEFETVDDRIAVRITRLI